MCRVDLCVKVEIRLELLGLLDENQFSAESKKKSRNTYINLEDYLL